MGAVRNFERLNKPAHLSALAMKILKLYNSSDNEKWFTIFQEIDQTTQVTTSNTELKFMKFMIYQFKQTTDTGKFDHNDKLKVQTMMLEMFDIVFQRISQYYNHLEGLLKKCWLLISNDNYMKSESFLSLLLRRVVRLKGAIEIRKDSE